MARYIDADELMEKIKKCEFDITGCGIMYDAGGVQSAINTQRTADVVPKSEVEQLKRNLEQCENGYRQEMHLLQCKLTNAKSEVEELKQIYRRYNKAIKNERAEVAREIFEEIYEDCFDQYGYINYEALAELKKKYTEEKK